MYCFFFFNDTATTEIYTLSLHDALPISGALQAEAEGDAGLDVAPRSRSRHHDLQPARQTLSRRSERRETARPAATTIPSAVLRPASSARPPTSGAASRPPPEPNVMTTDTAAPARPGNRSPADDCASGAM